MQEWQGPVISLTNLLPFIMSTGQRPSCHRVLVADMLLPVSNSLLLKHWAFFFLPPLFSVYISFLFLSISLPPPFHFFFLPSFISLWSGWTGIEPTNTAIKRTPVLVWKRYRGPWVSQDTLTWIVVFVATSFVQPAVIQLIHNDNCCHAKQTSELFWFLQHIEL